MLNIPADTEFARNDKEMVIMETIAKVLSDHRVLKGHPTDFTGEQIVA